MVIKKIPLMRPWVGEQEKQAVADVIDSGWLTEGEVVAEFEDAVAKYVGVKHAIAVPSCSIGLDLAFRVSSNCMMSDDVLVPDFTHPATVNCVLHNNLVPTLIDVSRSTKCVDVDALDYAADDDMSPGAVVLVSWGGRPIEDSVWNHELCDGDHFVIEDCACSLGARQSNGCMVGSFADVSVLSFHPRKIITTGEGGMIVTNDCGIASELRVRKDFGWDDGQIECAGYNMKMSDINAAIGLVQLGKIDQIVEERNTMAVVYDKLFKDVDHVVTPAQSVCWDERQTYQSYCVEVDRPDWRNALIRDLKKLGIETQIGTYALHLQPFYATHVDQCGDLHNSTELYHTLLTLPMYHGLDAEDQERVVDEIGTLFRQYVR